MLDHHLQDKSGMSDDVIAGAGGLEIQTVKHDIFKGTAGEGRP